MTPPKINDIISRPITPPQTDHVGDTRSGTIFNIMKSALAPKQTKGPSGKPPSARNSTVQHRLKTAVTENRQGHYPAAEVLAQTGLQESVVHIDLFVQLNLQLAFALNNQRKFTEAENAARAGLEAIKTGASADCIAKLHLQLVWALRYQKKYQEAKIMAQEALTANPSDHDRTALNLQLIATFISLGNYSKAQEVAEEELRVKSRNLARIEQFKVCLMTVLNKQGKHQEVIAQVQQPDVAHVAGFYIQWAIALNNLGEYKKAEDIALKGLKEKNLCPPTHIASLNLQLILALNNQCNHSEAAERAITVLNGVTSNDGHFIAKFYEQLSLAHNHLGHYQEAEKAAQTGLRQANLTYVNATVDLYLQLVLALNNQCKYSEAAEVAKTALKKVAPNDGNFIAKFYEQLSLAYNRLSHYREAEEAAQTGLQQANLTDVNATVDLYLQLVLALNNQCKYSEAAEVAKTALKKVAPNDDNFIAKFYEQLSLAYNHLSHYREAEEAAQIGLARAQESYLSVQLQAQLTFASDALRYIAHQDKRQKTDHEERL